MRTGLAVAVAVGLAAVAGACGESEPDKEATRDWLITEIELTETQADCVVDRVWPLDDSDDDDLLKELAEMNPDLDEDDEAALTEIVRSCTAGS